MPETTNLKLPIFNPEDKPSWLGNWNGAMNTIDQAVGRIDGDVAEDKAEIEAAQAAADAAKAAADAAAAGVTEVTGKVAAVETEVQSQGQMIETLQDDVQGIVPLSKIPIGRLFEGKTVTGNEKTFTVRKNAYAFILGDQIPNSNYYLSGVLLQSMTGSMSYDNMITLQDNITSTGMKLFLKAVFNGNIFNCSYSQSTTSVNRLYTIWLDKSTDNSGIGFIYLSDIDKTIIVDFNNTTSSLTFVQPLTAFFFSEYGYKNFNPTAIEMTLPNITGSNRNIPTWQGS